MNAGNLQPVPAGPGPASEAPLVLFVDDEPEILDLAAEYFRNFPGLRIRGMESAEAALAFHARTRADAIVSDYEMPGLDGIAFLQLVRSRGDETPFIVFTGRGREDVAMEALNFGADFYLQKRGDPDTEFFELRTMILQAVGGHRARKEARALAERVEQQAQILDEILSSIPEPVLIVDPDGRITYANLTGARVFGFSRMAILGRSLDSIALPPDAAGILADAAEQVFSTGLRSSREIAMHNGGTLRTYRCSLSPLHTSQGRINAVDILFADATDTARISQELRDCRSQVDALLGQERKAGGD
jgi:PAS domain S-box-containing protein